jgi:hypothetical protein
MQAVAELSSAPQSAASGPRALAPFATAALACAVLAAISAAVLPTVPSYDPWSWIVWGREVVDPHLSFAVGGGPSWKPLPVMFTTVFSLFGGAAPTLWVIAARAGGLLALPAAYRLAARIVAGPRWACAGAGVIAALAIPLTQDWFYYMFRGTSEPMVIASTLWAIDRHLVGRRGWAFVLGVALALLRPEATPFLVLYGAYLWVREPSLRPVVVVGVLAVPFFWFVPPWIGSGHPFLAASHAKAYNGHLGRHKLLEVLRRGVDIQTVPVLVAALVAVGLAVRRRDRLVPGLALAATAWWVLVVAMTLDGYPGLERFYLPAAAVACVLAGVGVTEVAQWAAGLVGPVRGAVGARGPTGPASGARSPGDAARRPAWGVAAVVALILIGASIPLMTGRISQARAQEPIASRAVTRLDQLSAAVRAVGGHDGVYPCHSSFASVNHSVQTALAWKLHVTLGRVGTTMRHQGLLFLGPHDSIDGGPPRIDPRLTQRQLIASVGVWRVYRMTAPGADTRCVGR